MVAVLLAAPGIASGGLDVAAWVRIDPDIGPGGGDRQGPDALKLTGIANDATAGCDVAPALAGAATDDAGTDVGGVAQPGRARRGDGIVGGRLRCRCGGERQTGYLDLAFMAASRRRAIPGVVAIAYADCRELECEPALSSLCDESMRAAMTASASWSIGCRAPS